VIARVDYYDESGRVVFSVPCEAERASALGFESYRVVGSAQNKGRELETTEARLFVDGTFWEIGRERVISRGEAISIDVEVPPKSMREDNTMMRLWTLMRSPLEEVETL
jgi:hypothetical protein